MEQKVQEVLQKWLEIDFYYIANKAGFINKSLAVEPQLINDTVRCLDYLTSMKQGKESTNLVITLISLMWTYVNHEKYDLRSFVVKILSRIGYPTSAIIADDYFDKENCLFTSLSSVVDQITVGLNQISNEVEVNGKYFLLTNFQKRIWDSMDEKKVIGISAPTSAGKSFVILLKIIKKLMNGIYDIVYIVPTLSLLNQVTEDFHTLLKSMKISQYRISNTFLPTEKSEANCIYVMTQEKAIAAFANEEKAFEKRMILVADEIQNIERIKEETDERAKILFDTLMEFRYKNNVEQIIISGPRIEDIDKLGKSIFGIETEDISTDISPVLNLTYSICKIDKKYYFKQYCMLNSNPKCEEITNSDIIYGYGKKLYNLQYLDYLSYFLEHIGKNEQNIIFAPTAPTARKIADYLSQNKEDKESNTDLIQYYKDTIHEKYTLCKTLGSGTAYHHGKLPMHVRRTLEKAIVEKKINNIVCTTTLMQGVNMPAQNIVIRNPHLYLKKTDSSEIAGPIPSSILIFDKFLLRKRRISPISFCHAKTADPEFAFCPVRAIPSILIHNTICLIPKWPSIRNRFPVFRHWQGNILIIRPDACFRGSSHSDKLAILCPCHNPLREVHPNPVSGKHNRPNRQFLFHGFRPYQKHFQKHRH